MNAIELNEAFENADKFQDGLAKFGTDFKTTYDPRNYIGLRYSNFSDVLPVIQRQGQNEEPEKKLTKEERAQARGGSTKMKIYKIESMPYLHIVYR